MANLLDCVENSVWHAFDYLALEGDGTAQKTKLKVSQNEPQEFLMHTVEFETKNEILNWLIVWNLSKTKIGNIQYLKVTLFEMQWEMWMPKSCIYTSKGIKCQ